MSAPAAATRRDTAEILQRLRRLAALLDTAVRIPGTNIRFGLDAIVGLVPAVGDAVTFAFAAWIVRQAAVIGVPRHTILRMLANILIDAVVGSIPVLGDIFDVAWKANIKNLALIEAHVRRNS